MLKLRRLKVDKFRSLARSAELRFSDGINVLLGQNGTGKTTLLELISMVVRSDFSSLAEEEFALEYELAEDEGERRIVRIRNERQAVEAPAPMLMVSGQRVYRATVEVHGSPDKSDVLRYDTEHGLSTGNAPPVSPADLPSLSNPAFLIALFHRAPRMLRPVNGSLLETGTARRFDESLDLFRRLTEGDLPGEFAVFEPGEWGPNVKAWLLIPAEIVGQMTRLGVPKEPEYVFTHDKLAFLATLKDLMGFSSCELRVDVKEVSDRNDSFANVRLGNLRFRFGLADGAFLPHDRLSYGQKRLVTFFYYLACNPDIIIADELVNGLHHRWITASVEAIGQRQAFLTSQNPLLLDYIPFPSADDVLKSFVLCRVETRDGRPWWVWENMTEEDAQELFSAYEVGVEHVSEILQSRGLW